MKRQFSFLVLPLFVTLSLLAVFVLTTPAFAQDETPPTEPVPSEVEPAPETAPAEEAPAETALLAETLSDAGVEVVDESGEAIPLVNNVLTDVDPWFKVGTTTYSFTLADCDPDTGGYQACDNPLQAAVNYISNNAKVPSDGFIHVDAGTLPNQQVTIIGNTSASLLKLKGIAGHVNPDTGAPDAILSDTSGYGSWIYVTNMVSGFTLSGLNITGSSEGAPLFSVTELINNSGPIVLQDLVVQDLWASGKGIRVTTQNGLVTLKNVQSNGNAGGGAYIDNSTGTTGVTITNSSFDGNTGNSTVNGLYIRTKGPVTITGSSASRNAGTLTAMWIQDASAITIKSTVIVGNHNYLGLAADGASGRLKANVTLQDVYSDNNLYGMVIFTYGNITLTNVSASGNTNYGAVLDTCDFGGTCLNTTGTGKVTITSGAFNSNLNSAGSDLFGLSIKARGAVALTKVTASHNGSSGHNAIGAILNIHYSDLSSAVTVKTSSFDSNYGSGLAISAKGPINLTNIGALNSLNGYGAFLDNSYGTAAGVTLAGTSTSRNIFSGNILGGLFIYTKGSIKINYAQSNSNNSNGMYLFSGFPGVIQPVTLTNIEAGSNTGSGLNVFNNGAVSLSNFKGEYNHQFGALIGDSSTEIPSSVTISHAVITNSGYTLGGYDNLYLVSTGNVTLSYVNADNCAAGGAGCVGARLGEPSAPIGGNVTISSSTFNANKSRGLLVYAKGALKLTGITANGNTADGAYLDNRGGLSTLYPTASITNGTFLSNGNCGVQLYARGKTTLTNITANENGGIGVLIQNDLGPVSLLASGTGTNTFYHNGTNGVAIVAHGAVIANKVYASYNSTTPGLLIDNSSVIGNVTISTGEFNNNKYGIQVFSKGVISVKGISAQNNTMDGVQLDNTSSSAVIPPGVTISGSTSLSNYFNYNTGSGLKIRTRGPISISYANADFNGQRGMDLDESGWGGGNVTMRYVTTKFNSLSGIYVDIHGIFTGSYIKSIFNASTNFWDGLTIYAHNSAVTISNSVIMGNGGFGIRCTFTTGSLAPFKLTSVIVVGNQVSQIYVLR